MAETGQIAAWQLSDGELAAAICASEKAMRAAYAQHLDLVAEHEETLVTLARQATPSTVRKAGQRILAYWDLEGKEPRDREDELARPRREFRHSRTRDRRMKFSGEFD